MFCSKCGTELVEDAKFCSKCGSAVDKKDEDTTIRKLHNPKFIWTILVLFAIVFVMLGSFVPTIKEESYAETNYYNFYQYMGKLFEEVDGDFILNWLAYDVGFDDVLLSIAFIGAVFANVICLISGLVVIVKFVNEREIRGGLLGLFMVSAEIFAACYVFLAWTGITYGEPYFAHYDYLWGETLKTDLSITVVFLVLFILPIVAFIIYKKYIYEKTVFTLHKMCPTCGREIFMGDNCTYCSNK